MQQLTLEVTTAIDLRAEQQQRAAGQRMAAVAEVDVAGAGQAAAGIDSGAAEDESEVDSAAMAAEAVVESEQERNAAVAAEAVVESEQERDAAETAQLELEAAAEARRTLAEFERRDRERLERRAARQAAADRKLRELEAAAVSTTLNPALRRQRADAQPSAGIPSPAAGAASTGSRRHGGAPDGAAWARIGAHRRRSGPRTRPTRRPQARRSVMLEEKLRTDLQFERDVAQREEAEAAALLAAEAAAKDAAAAETELRAREAHDRRTAQLMQLDAVVEDLMLEVLVSDCPAVAQAGAAFAEEVRAAARLSAENQRADEERLRVAQARTAELQAASARSVSLSSERLRALHTQRASLDARAERRAPSPEAAAGDGRAEPAGPEPDRSVFEKPRLVRKKAQFRRTLCRSGASFDVDFLDAAGGAVLLARVPSDDKVVRAGDAVLAVEGTPVFDAMGAAALVRSRAVDGGTTLRITLERTSGAVEPPTAVAAANPAGAIAQEQQRLRSGVVVPFPSPPAVDGRTSSAVAAPRTAQRPPTGVDASPSLAEPSPQTPVEARPPQYDASPGALGDEAMQLGIAAGGPVTARRTARRPGRVPPTPAEAAARLKLATRAEVRRLAALEDAASAADALPSATSMLLGLEATAPSLQATFGHQGGVPPRMIDLNSVSDRPHARGTGGERVAEDEDELGEAAVEVEWATAAAAAVDVEPAERVAAEAERAAAEAAAAAEAEQARAAAAAEAERARAEAAAVAEAERAAVEAAAAAEAEQARTAAAAEAERAKAEAAAAAEAERAVAEAAAAAEVEQARAAAVAEAERAAAEAAAAAEAEREAAEAAAAAEAEHARAAAAAEAERAAAEAEAERAAAEAAAAADAEQARAAAAAEAERTAAEAEAERAAAEAAAAAEAEQARAAAAAEAERTRAEAAAAAEGETAAAEAAAATAADRATTEAEAVVAAEEERAAAEAAAATEAESGAAEAVALAEAGKEAERFLAKSAAAAEVERDAAEAGTASQAESVATRTDPAVATPPLLRKVSLYRRRLKRSGAQFGLKFNDSADGFVRISAVPEGEAVLQVGDRVVSLGGAPVQTAEDALRHVLTAESEGSDTLVLNLERVSAGPPQPPPRAIGDAPSPPHRLGVLRSPQAPTLGGGESTAPRADAGADADTTAARQQQQLEAEAEALRVAAEREAAQVAAARERELAAAREAEERRQLAQRREEERAEAQRREEAAEAARQAAAEQAARRQAVVDKQEAARQRREEEEARRRATLAKFNGAAAIPAGAARVLSASKQEAMPTRAPPADRGGTAPEPRRRFPSLEAIDDPLLLSDSSDDGDDSSSSTDDF